MRQMLPERGEVVCSRPARPYVAWRENKKVEEQKDAESQR